MEPATTIIKRLGGPAVVAEITGVHRTRVSNWMRPKAKGGTGGVIPHWHVPTLLEHAAKNGLPVEAADFAPVMPAREGAAA